jgi:hypothetical protein
LKSRHRSLKRETSEKLLPVCQDHICHSLAHYPDTPRFALTCEFLSSSWRPSESANRVKKAAPRSSSRPVTKEVCEQPTRRDLSGVPSKPSLPNFVILAPPPGIYPGESGCLLIRATGIKFPIKAKSDPPASRGPLRLHRSLGGADLSRVLRNILSRDESRLTSPLKKTTGRRIEPSQGHLCDRCSLEELIAVWQSCSLLMLFLAATSKGEAR